MISLILLKRKFTVTIDKGYLLLGFPYDLIDNGIIEGDAVSYFDCVIYIFIWRGKLRSFQGKWQGHGLMELSINDEKLAIYVLFPYM